MFSPNQMCRYLQGSTSSADEYNFLSDASNSAKGLGMENNENAWRLMTSQVHSNSLLKPRNDSYLQGDSTQLHLPQANELGAAMSKQQQQYCFFGNNVDSLGPLKDEPNSKRPFFNDDDGCNKNSFSTTQLSISIPMGSSEYLSPSVCTPDGELLMYILFYF